MPFDYVVSLDLAGRPCVVLGGGELAVGRVEGLLASRAEVRVVAAAPADRIAELAADPGTAVELARRTYRPGDLAGAFLAVATREDDADVVAAWAEAEQRGVLFAALDDTAHCHFGAVSTIRRGDLTVTISSAGRAPALSKRLRRELEEQIGPEHGELVDVLDAARAAARPRTVPFPEWARRWEDALSDLDQLLELVRAGRGDEARARVLAHIDPAAGDATAAA